MRKLVIFGMSVKIRNENHFIRFVATEERVK